MKVDDLSCKGFLISCDKNKQKFAIKDAYNFITEYIEQIYSDVTEEQILKKIKEDGKELNLETEVAYSKRNNNRLLSQIQTNVNCMCFIKINPIYKQIDPLRVVNAIMKDVHQENKEITRYCHRILPVERAFRAQHFRMLDQLDELLLKHSHSQQIKSWMLNFKCRNNQKFNYKQVLKEVEKLTKKYNHFPDIYYPQWAISIEINNHLMCLSICQKFKETNQYKLHKKIDKSKQIEQDEEENQKTQKPKRDREVHNNQYDQVKSKRKGQNNFASEKAQLTNENGQHKVINQLEDANQVKVDEEINKPSLLLEQKIEVPKEQDDVDIF